MQYRNRKTGAVITVSGSLSGPNWEEVVTAPPVPASGTEKTEKAPARTAKRTTAKAKKG